MEKPAGGVDTGQGLKGEVMVEKPLIWGLECPARTLVAQQARWHCLDCTLRMRTEVLRRADATVNETGGMFLVGFLLN